MPIRSFRAADGVQWQVWNVVPGRSETPERRLGYDRRAPEPIFRYTGPERRVNLDRRRPAPMLSPVLASGWLAFECPTEKRRLVPIPPHWDRLGDADLERLCASARPVGPSFFPPKTPPPPGTN